MLVTLAWEILRLRRDIDHAGVALRIDQLQDALEVILDRGGIAGGMWSWQARWEERVGGNACSVKQIIFFR